MQNVDLAYISTELEKVEAEIRACSARRSVLQSQLISTTMFSLELSEAETALRSLEAKRKALLDLQYKVINSIALEKAPLARESCAAAAAAASGEQRPPGAEPAGRECTCADDSGWEFDTEKDSLMCKNCGRRAGSRLNEAVYTVAFEDLPTRRRSGGYRPAVHFAEVMMNLQAKRLTPIPAVVIDRVRQMCDDFHIPRKKCTVGIVRKFLRMMQNEQMDGQRGASAYGSDPLLPPTRRAPAAPAYMVDADAAEEARMDAEDRYAEARKPIRYTEYYKQSPEIAKQISGVPPLVITPTQEERISNMFSIAIHSYKLSPRYMSRLEKCGDKKKPPNNQSCYYILYKICQLLDYREFLPYIPLPKSIENIDDNDERGWKFICERNGWAYIPTR